MTLHKYLDFHFLSPVLIGKLEQKPKHQLQIQDKVREVVASTPLGRAKSTGTLKDVSTNKSHSEAMQLFLEHESPPYNNKQRRGISLPLCKINEAALIGVLFV